MKKIDTLVEDIYAFLVDDNAQVEEDKVEEFTKSMVRIMTDRLSRGKQAFRLRMSNFGKPCPRALWYEKHMPEKLEPLAPYTIMKFMYGAVLEELLLFLASCAGHKVEGMQDQLNVHGVTGSRDAVIDGVLVDVKSANARSYKKFAFHEVPKEDSFGYMDQLHLYLSGSKDDPLVTNKKEAAFFAVDKELGHICIDTYEFPVKDWEREVARKKALLDQPVPPDRAFHPEPDGKSGNMQLSLACRYCPAKKECWPMLRTFIYSNGPRFLTTVARVPDVKEV